MSGQDVYYILLVRKIGRKKERSILRPSNSEVEVLPGSLLVHIEETNNKHGQLVWILELLEPESTEVECYFDEIQQLKHQELNLLQPIPVLSERVTVFHDKIWLNEGVTLSLGDPVIVSLKGNPDLAGTLRYKGVLKDNTGIQFGVELSRENRGKGTCDGVFRKKRYFTTEANSSVFVPLNKIRRDLTKPASHGTAGATGFANEQQTFSEYHDLREKDRVVWMSDSGAEYGIVKWIGILPDSRNQEVTVGVEFDNPVGSGTGKYKNTRLFYARAQHASLVPIMGLIKADDVTVRDTAPNYGDSNKIFMEGSSTTPELLREQEKLLLEAEKRKISQQNTEKFGAQQQYSKQGTQSYPREEQFKPFDVKSKVTADVHAPPKQIAMTKPMYRQSEPTEDSSKGQGLNPVYEYNKTNQDLSPPEPVIRESLEQPVSGGSKRGQELVIPDADPDLEVGSMVEVMNNPPLYGVIKWTGYLPDQKKPLKPIAGLEMEEEISAGTDGTFGQHRMFICAPRKAFFVPLYKCRKDKRFVESKMSLEDAMGNNNFGRIETPDVPGNISPPDSMDVFDIKRRVCGKERGIQGHHNSCYLDATLFSMFYFTTVFDGILYRPKRSNDLPEYEEVKQVIKEGIVNPLRRYHYVRADKVMRLRQLLHKLGNIPGMMSEEKDPEEFLSLLLNQITKADPLLHIRSEVGQEVQHSFLYQLIMEKDERLLLPTTQQLFELSFLQMGVKLQERPSCLIIQMPRFGKDYKMYNRIVPSLELDISDVLECAPRECIICGDLAMFECKDCYNTHGAGLNTIAFCEGCKQMSHMHKLRQHHKPRKISVPQEYRDRHSHQKNVTGQNPSIPREKMELFAVVCIQTSHYVSFVKCGKGRGAPWLFFDSMADRMGEQSGYNIPEVKLCKDLAQWLSDDYQTEIMRHRDDKDLPEHMRRLLCDAYMCMYQNPEVSMFK
ncbi:ubiquitin carboxyl-terminal hydrolase CYLD-like [Pecten maximus]|uniref:ubiquitin carboxyl-terminal hydrolase CYLD-like n=1 Tax=Pecten maximus TaxID=6579 RepID=UPI0014588F76|nr:ubiquitin carboxyl-terminal hydrolase CYLD-like [Pecten maximus]